MEHNCEHEREHITIHFLSLSFYFTHATIIVTCEINTLRINVISGV